MCSPVRRTASLTALPPRVRFPPPSIQRTKKETTKVSFPVLEPVAGIDRLCLEHILRPRSPSRAAQTSACSPVRRTASLTALPSRVRFPPPSIQRTKKETTKVSFPVLEPVAGIEPATASLRMKCSAIEPHRHICFLTKNIILHRCHDFQYYLQTFYCIQFSQKLAGLSMFDMVTYSEYVCFLFYSRGITV